MATYKLQLNSKFYKMFLAFFCVSIIFPIEDTIVFVRMCMNEVTPLTILLGFRILLGIAFSIGLFLYLHRRNVQLFSKFFVMSFGIKTKYINYNELSKAEWVTEEEAKWHRQWDYGDKKSKIVLTCKSGENVYICVEKANEFLELIQEKISSTAVRSTRC